MRDELIVLGDSGHAKVCIELLRTMGYQVAYCVGVTDVQDCLGVPVLRGDEHLARLRAEGYSQAFVAIGINAVRRRIASVLTGQGFHLVNAISPQAVLSPSVRLGEGVAIMAGVVINADVTIGSLAIVNTGACIDHDCRIGDAAHIGPICGLAGNVIVGAGSFLGVGCKVIPGVCIGREVVVGAGAVVVRDLPDNIRAMGVPARPIQRRV
jgi:UDP-perosamine 4-acetyltransferase